MSLHAQTEEPRLPPCQRCKMRKTRCDRAAPKCTACARSSSACLISDPITNQMHSRESIHRLQERERVLLRRLQRQRQAQRPSTAQSLDSFEHSPTVANAPSAAASESHGHGLNFFRSLLTSSDKLANPLQPERNIQNNTQSQPILANALPSHEEASRLIENYFGRFHIHHTFLLRQNVLDTFQRVYDPGPTTNATSVDRFRLLMIFAVSAITRYRAGLSSEHPYGYYLAAQAYLGSVPLIGSVEAVENLLLIARFAMYHRCGVSLWDMSQLCMRQCIEWGLHQPPRAPLEPLEEQRRRRIFWECYLLDRKSSGFLGLPYAIPEAEICVELPVSVDDTTIKQSRAPSLSEITDSPDSTPTELCVFLYFIRLRRITSRVHLAFYAQHIANRRERSSANAQFASTAAVLTRLNELQKELDDWRRDAPVFASPKSLYQRPEWYDFLLERDKLLLIRGAIHNTNHDKSPPTDLLTICLDVATRVIELFFIMLRNNEITWTKGYLQVIFTACLSIINCISLDVHKMTGRIAAEHPREALPLYVEMLRQFKQRVPQASSVKFIFDAVQKRYMANTGLRTSHDEVFGPIYSESTSQVYPGPKESQGQATPAADGPNVIFQSSNNGAGVGAASAELGSPFTWDHDAAGDAALAVPQMALGPEGSFEWLHVSDEMLEHLEADMGYQTWSSPRADMYVWDQLDQVL